MEFACVVFKEPKQKNKNKKNSLTFDFRRLKATSPLAPNIANFILIFILQNAIDPVSKAQRLLMLFLLMNMQ